jgi:hypothetical protein
MKTANHRTSLTVALALVFQFIILNSLFSIPAFAGSQPVGNQNGATVTINTPLVGQVVLSNARIVYTGSGDQATLRSNSDVENVVFTGTANIRIADGATGVKLIHDDLPRVYNTGGFSNLLEAGNIYHVGIGAQQSFDGLDCESLGSNCVVTDNLFSPMHEGLHFSGGSGSGDVVQFNSFTGIQRHAIEIQAHTTGLRVENNYASNWNKNPGDNYQGPNTDSHIALSIATGNDGNPATTGNVITGNAIDFSSGQISVPLVAANAYLTTGIENMGNAGTVENNWIKNSGQQLYTNDNGFTSSGNVIIGGKSWSAEGGVNPAVAPTLGSPVDQLFAWGAANAPPMPANIGPRIIPGPASTAVPSGGWAGSVVMLPVTPVVPVIVTTAPATAPATIAVTPTNNADSSATFTWKVPAGASGSPTLTIMPTNGPATMAQAFPLAAGAAAAKVGSIPVNWQVTATVSYGSAGSGSATVQVTGGAAAPSNTAWSPVIWWLHQ